MKRLSLRLRLTLAFSLVMAVLLGVTGLLVYDFFRSDLNNNIDNSLSGRSGAVAAIARDSDGPSDVSLSGVTGSGEDFAQVLTLDGRVVASTPQVEGHALLTAMRCDARPPAP